MTMKKQLLYFLALLVFASPTFASASNPTVFNSYSNYDGNSITLVERNVTFSVFRNGEFDFYINSAGSNFNANLFNDGFSISYNSGYDYIKYIQYDDFGAIIQIENIPINYDYYGRVNRIGSIQINYNKYGSIKQLGGLFLFYNSSGYYSHYSGFINNYNTSYVYHPYHTYFTRPYANFCIVRYEPYRAHYQPFRRVYHKDYEHFVYNKKHYDKDYRYNRKSNFNKLNETTRSYSQADKEGKNTVNRTNTKNSISSTNKRITANNSRVNYNSSINRNKNSSVNRNNNNVNRNNKFVNRKNAERTQNDVYARISEKTNRNSTAKRTSSTPKNSMVERRETPKKTVVTRSNKNYAKREVSKNNNVKSKSNTRTRD